MKLIESLGMKYATKTSKTKTKFGIYECPVCKKHFETNSYNVKKGMVTKCKSCAIRIKGTTHGLSDTRLFGIWCAMKTRCYNKNTQFFSIYGGSGVTVCDKWKNDFMAFYTWAINNGYEEHLTIDRINNDGNYEPSNCRWVSQSVQSRNTRRLHLNNKSGYRGASLCQNKWTSRIRNNGCCIHLGRFNTAIEAGYAYDKYVIDNNLEHTTNGLYKKGMSYEKGRSTSRN